MAETSSRAGEKGTIVQIIGAVVDVEFRWNLTTSYLVHQQFNIRGKKNGRNIKSCW